MRVLGRTAHENLFNLSIAQSISETVPRGEILVWHTPEPIVA